MNRITDCIRRVFGTHKPRPVHDRIEPTITFDPPARLVTADFSQAEERAAAFHAKHKRHGPGLGAPGEGFQPATEHSLHMVIEMRGGEVVGAYTDSGRRIDLAILDLDDHELVPLEWVHILRPASEDPAWARVVDVQKDPRSTYDAFHQLYAGEREDG